MRPGVQTHRPTFDNRLRLSLDERADRGATISRAPEIRAATDSTAATPDLYAAIRRRPAAGGARRAAPRATILREPEAGGQLTR